MKTEINKICNNIIKTQLEPKIIIFELLKDIEYINKIIDSDNNDITYYIVKQLLISNAIVFRTNKINDTIISVECQYDNKKIMVTKEEYHLALQLYQRLEETQRNNLTLDDILKLPLIKFLDLYHKFELKFNEYN